MLSIFNRIIGPFLGQIMTHMVDEKRRRIPGTPVIVIEIYQTYTKPTKLSTEETGTLCSTLKSELDCDCGAASRAQIN